MYQFVADSVEGLGKKRKASQRACSQCRAKRKRCDHAHSEGSSRSAPTVRHSSRDNTFVQGATNTESAHTQGSSIVPNPSGQVLSGGTAQPSENVVSPRTQLQFVGELSPTAVFQSNRAAQDGADVHDSHSVGVWIDRSRRINKNSRQAIDADYSSLQVSYKPVALQALLPYLSETCCSVVPPEDDYQALKSIYFAKIHPLCPILIESPLLDNTKKSDAACLRQAVCIVASMDPSAKSYLHLPGSEELLNGTDFSRRLADTVRTSLDLGFVNDDVVLVQITALMALYVDGASGSTTSARYCSEAVHHAQNLGLHLSRPNSPSRHTMDQLFSCVWAIDRLNAAVNGRPVLLHNWDLGVSLPEIINNSAPTFRLFLKICTLLDNVIFLYRPQYRQQDGSAGSQNPTFEELVMACEAKDVDSPLLASLELFYHAVAILSHRPSSTVQTSIPAAQRYSADKITSIVANEFSFRLSMWILTPYAVSLSLSTAYRELRSTSIPNNRRRAHAAFQVNCQLLEHLSPFFWSARAMAELAKETLGEMERVTTRMAITQTTQDTTADQQGSPRQNTRTSSKARRKEVQQETFAAHEDAVDWLPSTDPSRHHLADIQYDPNLFLSIPDMDIFTRFDPDFDLSNVDAVLQGNLDLSLPWT